MPKPQLTNEKITELLEKSHERSFQRYHDEFRQEIWEKVRAEPVKNGEEKEKKELLVNS